MHNPTTGDTVEAEGPQVQHYKDQGYDVVGERPESEYPGGEPEATPKNDPNEGPSSHETAGQFPADEVRETHEGE